MNDQAPKSRTSALMPIVKLVVSVVLIAVLLSRIDISTLWATARRAQISWLVLALGVYLLMVLTSAWRWGLLLKAQRVHLGFGRLTTSFLVATFWNNFLPSNIGGDVIRIADTAPAAGSKTRAATVVLVDRGLGLLGLVLVAAVGATAGPRLIQSGPGVGSQMLWAAFVAGALIAVPVLLVPRALPRLLQPLRIVHPAWIDERLARLGGTLERFRDRPGALLSCFVGAVAVQAILVGFYLAIARSMHIPIGFTELAVVVPISFIVQMVPVSMNGFGVREATFGFYFTRLGLPLESALLVSLMGAALIMVFSLSGAAAYLVRKRHPSPTGEIAESL